MQLLSRQGLKPFLSHDSILARLRGSEQSGDGDFISHRWLLDSPPKRFLYFLMYGELLDSKAPCRVLDIGGGFCSLSRLLVSKHDYWLCEINAHDSARRLRDEEERLAKRFWLDADWYDLPSDSPFDVVIANDLFPNVDQRLEIFLERFLPQAREIRLSLTYYPKPRFYKTRRIDGGEEVLFMMAWDGMQTRRVLERFSDALMEPHLDLLTKQNDSIFENQRQVCIARLRGR